MSCCLLLVYCEQVYATCFDSYLGHHQAIFIEHKLSYLNLISLIWIHITQFFVAAIICEYMLKNCVES
jgi:hypothetical protein